VTRGSKSRGEQGRQAAAAPRILIVTSCTGEKSVTQERALTLADFEKGAAHVKKREQELKEQLTQAEDLYSGLQHVRLMRGVRAFREAHAPNGSGAMLDLWILSAGYGLVPGDLPPKCGDVHTFLAIWGQGGSPRSYWNRDPGWKHL
jgi:hypothetical protein